MKIAIACDHGGLNLKKALIEYLVKNGYEYVDFGTNGTEALSNIVHGRLPKSLNRKRTVQITP